jgi:DNA invertase Pin-like site-specific DNA recombinase
MDAQKRAWIYTRIDAPEDTCGVLKKQEKALYDYADQMGLAVTGSSSDLGGSDRGMPGLARVTDAAERDAFDVLLIGSLSRLGRNAAHAASVLNEMKLFGVEVYSPSEGKIGMETPGGISSGEKTEPERHCHA